MNQHAKNQQYAIDNFGLHYTRLRKLSPLELRAALGFKTWRESVIMCFGSDLGFATVFENVPFDIPHREFVNLCREILEDYSPLATFDLEALAILQEHTEFFMQRGLGLADMAAAPGSETISFEKLQQEMGVSWRPWEPAGEEADDEEYVQEIDELAGQMDIDLDTENDINEGHNDEDSDKDDDASSTSSSSSSMDSEYYACELVKSYLNDITTTNQLGETPAHFFAQLHPTNLSLYHYEVDFEKFHALRDPCLGDQARFAKNIRGTHAVHLINRVESLFGEGGDDEIPQMVNSDLEYFHGRFAGEEKDLYDHDEMEDTNMEKETVREREQWRKDPFENETFGGVHGDREFALGEEEFIVKQRKV
ncbi:UNVERIFIED_CONTAM: hypothetical protein HDU68_012195 [Siphonaria sp. JEL0065]|nr:hypothetical protein HDU68_012195 [Siphonaria sp. JEL0065]